MILYLLGGAGRASTIGLPVVFAFVDELLLPDACRDEGSFLAPFDVLGVLEEDVFFDEEELELVVEDFPLTFLLTASLAFLTACLPAFLPAFLASFLPVSTPALRASLPNSFPTAYAPFPTALTPFSVSFPTTFAPALTLSLSFLPEPFFPEAADADEALDATDSLEATDDNDEELSEWGSPFAWSRCCQQWVSPSLHRC